MYCTYKAMMYSKEYNDMDVGLKVKHSLFGHEDYVLLL